MLRLRPYKKCDADKIVTWIKDEVTFRKWCADRYEKYPITSDDMNSYYDSFDFSDSFFPMTAFDETGVVGHLIIRFLDDEKQIIRLGFVIVDDSKRGKGYGREMLGLALRYAFGMLKADKVTIGVFENNMPAYHCYKAVGFHDTDPENNKIIHILDEDWKRLELEINSGL